MDQAMEAQIVALTNQQRGKLGLAPLASDSVLATVARGHSEEMARLNYFEHESPTPGRTDPWDRANLAGVDSNEFAENIFFAEGHAPTKVAGLAVAAWMKSPGHRANLLGVGYSRVGIGLARHNKQVYVTQLFSADLQPYAAPAKSL
jgi:uncharacterized protein YkwD